ncbi:MAG: FkbM family methyltransferase [Methylococcales symbiont of Hymedesmia sp. n. MRB-2018]|nr:MAG: FkbM family methyltransferase [Methylococcales symbiont of Hymedesmia sp. n. MRB-2018]KAF3984294.1 MAG: FkbM family methyltransferase [Methylococcales symbiont of Hymedesmia sp. n. MRB-2018]
MIFKLKKLINILKEPFFIKALLKGTASGVEHRAILESLHTCQHVIDIGANRGQFALISRKCFPECQIDSFEPLQEPATIYQSVFDNDKKVKLYPYAIGKEKSEAIIHVSNRDDSSSLLPISSVQTNLFPETIEKETRIIQVMPLDEFFSKNTIISPALLKIDVQGFELSTLQGCSSLLYRFEYIYVECSFIELYKGQSFADEVITFLSNYKFKLLGVYNMYYNKQGQAVQADFLFKINT